MCSRLPSLFLFKRKKWKEGIKNFFFYDTIFLGVNLYEKNNHQNISS